MAALMTALFVARWSRSTKLLGGQEWSSALNGTLRVMVVFGGDTCDLLFADCTRPAYVKRMSRSRLTHAPQRTRVLRTESVALKINRFEEPFDKPSHQKIWRSRLGVTVTVFTSREAWGLQGACNSEYDRYRRVNPTAPDEDVCAAAGDAMANVFTEAVALRTTTRRLGSRWSKRRCARGHLSQPPPGDFKPGGDAT
jgi:hypothetical protein